MTKLLYTPNISKKGYKFQFAYPACESFALASLGYLWLSKIVDEMEGINQERIYTDSEMVKNKPESIGFSMSFDFDFMGVFEVLEKQKIPFLREDRDENYPLIFAGGPVITTNPAPYEKIFDFMIAILKTFPKCSTLIDNNSFSLFSQMFISKFPQEYWGKLLSLKNWFFNFARGRIPVFLQNSVDESISIC